jgi:hypothetical protein
MANAGIHAAVGMAISKLIPIWWLSLPLAFLSHFIMDLYPEAAVGEYNFKKKENRLFVIVETLLVILVIIVCIVEHSWLLALSALMANLPDMWDAINVLLKKDRFWFVHGGKFPISVKFEDWQGFSMKPFQNAILDLMFVGLILLLIMF